MYYIPKLKLLAVLLALIVVSGCKTELYTGLTEREANEIVSVLRLSGVAADRQVGKDENVTVFVDEDAFALAVEILKSEGYPKRAYSNLGDVFQGKGFVVSQTEERARFIFAMSEELSRTISEIDGILSARTHVVLPTSDPLSRNSTPSSASIVIRHAAQAATESLLPQIKMMVANSIEGLEYSNVSVVFIPVQKREFNAGSLPIVASDNLPSAPAWIFGGIGFVGLLLIAGGFFLFSRRRNAADSDDFLIESASPKGAEGHA